RRVRRHAVGTMWESHLAVERRLNPVVIAANPRAIVKYRLARNRPRPHAETPTMKPLCRPALLPLVLLVVSSPTAAQTKPPVVGKGIREPKLVRALEVTDEQSFDPEAPVDKHLGGKSRERTEGVNFVAFGPDGKQLIAGSTQGASIWKLGEQGPSEPISLKHVSRVPAIGLSRDGKTLARVEGAQSIRLWASTGHAPP